MNLSDATTAAEPDVLLDWPAPTAARFAALEDAIRGLIQTEADVILPQAEATLALEAAARGLGRPGVTALNVITSPYGGMFGRWLTESGAHVIDVDLGLAAAANAAVIADALADHPEISIVSLVHGEAITGAQSDLAAVAPLVASHGALFVVDAVASFGATAVDIDGWGIDIGVIGPQKALAGPAGISVVTVSPKAWAALDANPGAPRGSSLSLLDWKTGWLDASRTAIPGTPSPLEVYALEAAVRRVTTAGLTTLIARHEAARAASRAGLAALGLTPWVSDDIAAAITTTVAAPEGIAPVDLVSSIKAVFPEAAVSVGYGPLRDHVVRIDHTGRRARLDVVIGALSALGEQLGGSWSERLPAAVAAAEGAWAERSGS